MVTGVKKGLGGAEFLPNIYVLEGKNY